MKHVLDRSRENRRSDVSKAARVFDKERPRQTTLALQRRARLRDETTRRTQYQRVAANLDDLA